ncbi:TNF receptor-associated factor 4-like [Dysidea avara]|uniref:TNF receptor-associated factor 4-like n=1 Tax=Dysidea avara TaxID=196820 RepID=UPI003322F347
MCRNEELSSVLNKQIDREVKGLTVHCTNNKDGCMWRGELRHLTAHRRTCNYELVQCEYHGIGCEKELYRENLKDHNKRSAEEHLAMSVRKLKNLEHITHQLSMGNMIRNRSMQLDALSMMMETSGDLACPVILKVPEFTRKKTYNKLYSNSFYSHKKGYKMCLCVYPVGNGEGKGTDLSVALFLMKGPHDDELTWPLRGKFEITRMLMMNVLVESLMVTELLEGGVL